MGLSESRGMTTFLQHFPEPFLKDLVQGRCLPVIGAGFSRNAEVPLGKTMPLWDDLGRELAKKITNYPYSTAIDALSAYAFEFSRPKLVEELADLLLVDTSKPGAAHLAFCNLQFDRICTTNFDFLLERGYQSVNKYCRPVIDEDQLSVAIQQSTVVLLKMHGDLHHPARLVATEEDYDAFLERYPLLATYLANLLISKTPLFIGYSLEDHDFRQLWQVIAERLGNLRRMAYTIRVNASSSDIARFQRRGVRVINLPSGGLSYGEVLSLAFEELGQYWSQELLKGSIVLQEEPLRHLILSEEAPSRLCFFSLPITGQQHLYSFYRNEVFPIVESYGFAPITGEDVVSPGENIIAKVSALIDKSEVVVADVGSASAGVFAELHLAIARLSQLDAILVITEEKTKLSPFLTFSGARYLERPKDPYLRPQQFLEMLDAWFGVLADSRLPDFHEEPARLLQKREYRAAVISAISVLEAELTRAVRSRDLDRGPGLRPYGSRQLVDLAVQMGLVDGEDLPRVREWLYLRNQAVHSTKRITAKQARAAVEGVLAVVKRLRNSDR